MRRLLHFLFGYVSLRFDRRLAEDVINALRQEKIDSWRYCEADEEFVVCTNRAGAKLLCSDILREQAVKRHEHGLPALVVEHRSRIGLLIGTVVSALIFLLSFQFVWDVRVEGNERLSDAQIRQELAEAGLRVGNGIRKIDTKAVASDTLTTSADLSFLSVNMHGCVAYVTVRERDMADLPSLSAGCANLVASTDAVIDSLSVSRGEVKVHAGQVVREGQLLVSGITDGLGGSLLVYAQGEVIGRVVRQFSVTVPRVITQKRETEIKTTAFSILFWGKTINIYRNTGNLPVEYDTIYQSDMCYLWGDLRLPFGTAREVAVSYTMEEQQLTADEQVALAYRQLENEMALALKDAELLSKHIYGTFSEDGYTLICDVECLINIAATQEVIADGNGG